MNLLFWGLTISVVGKILLAAGVIIAHTELAHERRIDNEVLQSFRLEMVLTVVGILLIVLGYAMEIYFYGFTPLLTCSGNECGALLINAFETTQ
jgi:uncharacterized membrane protein